LNYKIIFLAILALFILACEEDTTAPEKVLVAPSNLVLQQLSEHNIKLSWDDNNDHDSGFRVDRRVGDAEWEQNYRILGDTVNSIVDSSLVEIANYSYRIYTFYEEETSGFTEATMLFSYNYLNSITAEDNLLLSPDDSQEIQFLLKDNRNYPMEGEYQVWVKMLSFPYATNINNELFNEVDSLLINSLNGTASFTVNSGWGEGEIELLVYAKNYREEVISSSLTGSVETLYFDVASLEFTNPNPIFIDVEAVGGDESAEIGVKLLDASGELVNGSFMVFWELIESPNDTRINYYGTDDDNGISIDGEAVVALFSGQRSGEVTLQAYVTNNAGEVISIVRDDISVLAGPVEQAEFAFEGINEAENMGDGNWKIEVILLLTDMYNNPASEGTPVNISISESADWAVLDSELVYVDGYDTGHGIMSGVASTFIVYDGLYTNEVITVHVEVENGINDEFTDSEQFRLPIQQPVLNVMLPETEIEWNEADPEEVVIELVCSLVDGQANPINNQILVFDSQAGFPLEPAPADTGDPYSGLTTEVDGQSGMLVKEFRFMKSECPPPENGEPGTREVELTAHIIGIDVEATATVTLIRNP